MDIKLLFNFDLLNSKHSGDPVSDIGLRFSWCSVRRDFSFASDTQTG